MKKQFKQETFHFFGILIIILIFLYFLGDYLLEATNGGVSNEEKNVGKVKVFASSQNTKAIEFYKKYGFKDYSLELEMNL